MLIDKEQNGGTRPSQWRLISLALGLAAILNVTGSFFDSMQLVRPTNWLLSPWISDNSLTYVSPLAVQIMRVGVDLWLIASVLVLVFWMIGLHRVIVGPRSIAKALGINLMWMASIAVSFLPYYVGQRYGHGEGARALLLVIGVYAMPVILLLVVWSIASVVGELMLLLGNRVTVPTYFPSRLLAAAVIPPILSIAPVLLDPSEPLARTASANDEFENLCRGVGVQLLEKPVRPVRSIVYDWNPERFGLLSQIVRQVELDEKGFVKTFAERKRPAEDVPKTPSFAFSESRAPRDGYPVIDPAAPEFRSPPRGDVAGAPFIHFYDFKLGRPYHGIDAPTADVLAFIDFDKTSESANVPSLPKGLTRYKITLIDRRSGATLGIQTYVIDGSNRRACGTNVGNTISQNAFIYDAINR